MIIRDAHGRIAPGTVPGNIVRPGDTMSATPAWRGDDIGYSAVHWRLRRYRGKATEHTCACGRGAHEWAFDEPTGASTNLSRYTPMCRLCHRAFDREGSPS